MATDASWVENSEPSLKSKMIMFRITIHPSIQKMTTPYILQALSFEIAPPPPTCCVAEKTACSSLPLTPRRSAHRPVSLTDHDHKVIPMTC